MSPFEPSPSAAPVFDEVEALARTGDDRDLFRELVQMILADLPDSLQQIETALARQDPEALHRATHKIKGHLSAVGCGPVVTAVRELDNHARAGDLENARLAQAELLHQLGRLRVDLDNWMRENAPDRPR